MRYIFLFLYFSHFICNAQSESFSIPVPDTLKPPESPGYKYVHNSSFNTGEELYFKASFGWFTVGKASIKVDKYLHQINGRSAFKIDVKGKTTGMVDWLASVDDHWGAYIDKTGMVSHKSYRYIKEGNYRKNEITRFDHSTDMIEVTVMDKKSGIYGNPKYYVADNNVQDMIGGFFFLRNMDFTGMKKGDFVKLTGFYEDTFYNMKIMYAGKEKIKTKLGTINTIKVIPIMPENSLFDGEDSIVAWISDDENRVPVKVSAEMFIGSAGVELIDVKNLKGKLNIDD